MASICLGPNELRNDTFPENCYAKDYANVQLVNLP